LTVRIHFKSPDALRRLLWAPGELGLARAYVAGDIEVEGSIFDLLALRNSIADPDEDGRIRLGGPGWVSLARSAVRSGGFGLPLPLPSTEPRLRGGLHSRARDREAVTHHYDVGNDFYRLLLGPTLTYSCAYFARPDIDLEEAQEAKYDLICSKLGLTRGMRLLDVGCGFGGMVIHAAHRYGVRAVGVTISPAQYGLAAQRVAAAGMADKVEIRLADYRDIHDGLYDAVSSIGMFEHVGLNRLQEYFTGLRDVLTEGGRLLNHAISRPAGAAPINRNSFMGRYVFPDAELHEVGSVISAMQGQSLEVRDVESLREHYARTTRAWVTNLEDGWDQAVAMIGLAKARIWRLYLAGSALGFEANRISVHQVLAVKTDREGRSGMPPTRESFRYIPETNLPSKI
jgi:cyclopropane-fatty-acyl-phospholipid synthase